MIPVTQMPEELNDNDEVLFRQIHPSFMDGDRPSSQPFSPTAKDEGKLSVDRSSKTTAESSYWLYTRNGYESAAVYGLTVGEFSEQDVPCFDDPLPGDEHTLPNPAHAYGDYNGHSASRRKNLAKRLKRKALDRGKLYP